MKKLIPMSKKIVKKRMADEPGINDGKNKYVLRLYVTGSSQKSEQAVVNINAICKKFLKNCYKLEIIDIYKQPELASSEEITVIPLLIKKFPQPEERMIGDLSNTEEVLKGLCIV